MDVKAWWSKTAWPFIRDTAWPAAWDFSAAWFRSVEESPLCHMASMVLGAIILVVLSVLG